SFNDQELRPGGFLPYFYRGRVIRRVVPRPGLVDRSKFDDAQSLWRPASLERFYLPAANDESSAEFLDGWRDHLLVVLIPFGIRNFDFENHIAAHCLLLL